MLRVQLEKPLKVYVIRGMVKGAQNGYVGPISGPQTVQKAHLFNPQWPPSGPQAGWTEAPAPHVWKHTLPAWSLSPLSAELVGDKIEAVSVHQLPNHQGHTSLNRHRALKPNVLMLEWWGSGNSLVQRSMSVPWDLLKFWHHCSLSQNSYTSCSYQSKLTSSGQQW